MKRYTVHERFASDFVNKMERIYKKPYTVLKTYRYNDGYYLILIFEDKDEKRLWDKLKKFSHTDEGDY
jgi:hypothetical protein